MRLHYVFLPVAAMFFIAGCQTGPSETDEQMLKSLNAMKKDLAGLKNELSQIKKEIKKNRIQSSSYYRIEKGPDIDALEKITLPENPTRKQISSYILKIIAASKQQNSFSTNDVQIGMLCKVGSANIDLLLPHIKNYYVRESVIFLVTEKDKIKVLEAFKKYPELITCIEKNNWEKDCRDTIFNYIKSNRTYLPYEMMQAAASLSTPQEYDILAQYFIRDMNPQTSYKALAKLKDFDMQSAVDKAWRLQKDSGNRWQRNQIAFIAAKYGHKDALKVIIDVYAISNNGNHHSRLRTDLFKLTGQILPPQKMYEWYNANKDKLVYDKDSQTYVIKGKKANSKQKERSCVN